MFSEITSEFESAAGPGPYGCRRRRRIFTDVTDLQIFSQAAN
jgi:hypothetical protein